MRQLTLAEHLRDLLIEVEVWTKAGPLPVAQETLAIGGLADGHLHREEPGQQVGMERQEPATHCNDRPFGHLDEPRSLGSSKGRWIPREQVARGFPSAELDLGVEIHWGTIKRGRYDRQQSRLPSGAMPAEDDASLGVGRRRWLAQCRGEFPRDACRQSGIDAPQRFAPQRLAALKRRCRRRHMPPRR